MKSYFKTHALKILVVLLFAVCCLISYFTGIGCIWKHIFGIPCPGCGFTRAVISAVRLDFKTAFSYNPMFWSFPFIVCYFFFADKLKGKIFDYIMLAIVFGFALFWVLRLCALI